MMIFSVDFFQKKSDFIFNTNLHCYITIKHSCTNIYSRKNKVSNKCKKNIMKNFVIEWLNRKSHILERKEPKFRFRNSNIIYKLRGNINAISAKKNQ